MERHNFVAGNILMAEQLNEMEDWIEQKAEQTDFDLTNKKIELLQNLLSGTALDVYKSEENGENKYAIQNKTVSVKELRGKTTQIQSHGYQLLSGAKAHNYANNNGSIREFSTAGRIFSRGDAEVAVSGGKYIVTYFFGVKKTKTPRCTVAKYNNGEYLGKNDYRSATQILSDRVVWNIDLTNEAEIPTHVFVYLTLDDGDTSFADEEIFATADIMLEQGEINHDLELYTGGKQSPNPTNTDYKTQPIVSTTAVNISVNGEVHTINFENGLQRLENNGKMDYDYIGADGKVYRNIKVLNTRLKATTVSHDMGYSIYYSEEKVSGALIAQNEKNCLCDGFLYSTDEKPNTKYLEDGYFFVGGTNIAFASTDAELAGYSIQLVYPTTNPTVDALSDEDAEFIRSLSYLPADTIINITDQDGKPLKWLAEYIRPNIESEERQSRERNVKAVASLPYSMTSCAYSDDYVVTISPCRGNGYAVAVFDNSNAINPAVVAHGDLGMYGVIDTGRADKDGSQIEGRKQIDPRSICIYKGNVITAWRGGSGRPFDYSEGKLNGSVLINSLPSLNEVCRLDFPHRISHVAAYNNLLYVSHQLAGFSVWNIENASNPQKLLEFYTGYPSQLYEFQKGGFVEQNGKTYLVIGGFNSYSYVLDVTHIETEATELQTLLESTLGDKSYVVDDNHKYYRMPMNFEFKDDKDNEVTHHTFHATMQYPYLYSTMSPSNSALQIKDEQGDVVETLSVHPYGHYGVVVTNLETFENKYIEIPLDEVGDYINNDVEPTELEEDGDYIYLNNSTKGVAVFSLKFGKEEPIYCGNIPVRNAIYGISKDENDNIYVTERWGYQKDYTPRNYNAWQINNSKTTK